MTKLTSTPSLKSYLDNVFSEGVKSTLHQKALTEKEKQASTGTPSQEPKDSSNDSGGFLGDTDDDSDDQENTSSKTMDDESEKLKSGDIKAKDIVERLNSIRSGKSFKDSSVSGAMEDYIDSLSKSEKVALLAFLKGISQIVTGDVSAQQAEDPSDHPADVKMDKTNEPEVVHKKPNVIKSPGRDSEKKDRPVEDTTSPAPITARRR